MVLNLDDSSNTANVALVRRVPPPLLSLLGLVCPRPQNVFRRRVRASKTKAATTSFSSSPLRFHFFAYL
jgi:hypothetical protein